MYQEQINDLTDGDWPFDSELVSVDVVAGFSNRGADLDNVIKPILDTYQLIYDDFNDNKVYKINLEKEIVKKGEEFLDVTFRKIEDD